MSHPDWKPRGPNIPTGRKHVPLEVSLRREIETLEIQISSVERMLHKARQRLWAKKRDLKAERAQARRAG